MLAKKMTASNTKCWLINTGCTFCPPLAPSLIVAFGNGCALGADVLPFLTHDRGRWRLRHRQALPAQVHPCDRRRDPRRLARAGQVPQDSGLRPRDPRTGQERPERAPRPGSRVGRQGLVQPDRGQARWHVQQGVRALRRRVRTRGCRRRPAGLRSSLASDCSAAPLSLSTFLCILGFLSVSLSHTPDARVIRGAQGCLVA